MYVCISMYVCMWITGKCFHQPGLAAAVAYRGDTLLSVGYGTIKKGSEIVPDGDTIFRIGSLTKIFTVSHACACMHAYVYVYTV